MMSAQSKTGIPLRIWQSAWGLSALVLTVACLQLPIAHADDDLELDRSLAEFVTIDNRVRQAGGDTSVAGEQDKTDIAVLPQIGVDPEAGFILGGKFSAVNFTDEHLNLDIGATQSTAGETDVDIRLGTPHLLGSDYIGQIRAQYQLQPRQNFYGLGNNGAGDDAMTQHEYHATSVMFTLARRLAPHWLVAGTIGFNRTSIGPGKPQDGRQSTGDAFGDLPGLKSGYNNPLSLTLIYNTQSDLTRPHKGWNIIGKVTHVGPELGNTYDYTRFIADASYIQPIFSPDHFLGFRIDGEYLLGSGDDLPFYEFASIGGERSLPGYYPNRFLGQSRIFAHMGYQQLLTEFDFYNIWHVRLDGSVFAGAGRVFLDRSRLPDELLENTPGVAPDLSNKIRYDYGAGLHIALDQALSARLIAGFSPESKGLIYLTFGNEF